MSSFTPARFIVPGTVQGSFAAGSSGSNAIVTVNLTAPTTDYSWDITALSFGYGAAPAAAQLMTVAGGGFTFTYPLTTTNFWMVPFTGGEYGLIFPSGSTVTITLPASGTVGVVGYVNVNAIQKPTTALI